MSTDEPPDDLAPLSARLRGGRPTPSAALRRRVYELSLATGPSYEVDLRRVRTLIALFASAGALLLAISAVVTFL
jgi:hypothetical protein